MPATRPKTRSASSNKNLQDRSQTILTQLPPWTVRYGRTIAGSTVVAVFTTDKSGCARTAKRSRRRTRTSNPSPHASHECAAINGYRINGIDVGELDDDGWAVNPIFRLSAEVRLPAIKTVEISLWLAYGGVAGSCPEGVRQGGRFYLGRVPYFYVFTGNIPNGLFTISGDGKDHHEQQCDYHPDGDVRTCRGEHAAYLVAPGARHGLSSIRS